MEFELHPLCTLFPRLSGYEFECLKLDIQENGQREPIIIHEGMILDGGNRYRACIDLGIEPQTMRFGGDNIATYVLSVNLHRRHLSEQQQAAIVSCVQNWAKAQIHGGTGVNQHKKTQSAPESTLRDTTKMRAAQSGASVSTQRRADAVAKADPELAAQVAQGKVKLQKAVELVAPQLSSKSKAEKQAFPKPTVAPLTPTPQESPPEYTELDSLRDQVEDLQAIVAAGFLAPTPEDRAGAQELIDDMRKEIKTLNINLAAVTKSRDDLMLENKQLKNQCLAQAKELKKLKK